MEKFDVLDKNRIFLNYTKERGTVLEEKEFNQGAEIWIINNNKILMTKRSLKKSHPGQWEVPGGCSQVGETTTCTIKRELEEEEIGINLKNEDLKFIGTSLYKKQFVDIFYSDIKVNFKDILLQDDEVSGIGFFSMNDFIKMKECNKIVPSVLDRYNLIKDKLHLK